MKALAAKVAVRGEEAVRRAFAKHDRASKGKISWENFVAVLKELGLDGMTTRKQVRFGIRV